MHLRHELHKYLKTPNSVKASQDADSLPAIPPSCAGEQSHTSLRQGCSHHGDLSSRHRHRPLIAEPPDWVQGVLMNWLLDHQACHSPSPFTRGLPEGLPTGSGQRTRYHEGSLEESGLSTAEVEAALMGEGIGEG